ncbi:MAG: rhomboid family intramembrane serine protease [Parvularculaceae bacterium]|nr:rhomboid family intramembrane serine protease [Parvularculaceae bacterium]
MFPIGDENGKRRLWPFMVAAIIAANVFVFYQQILGGEIFILKWAFVPSRFGADPAGEAATLVTAMFMHAGLAHLGGNMLYLWVFGDNIENRLGHAPFLAFYFASGLAATMCQYAVNPLSAIPNLGASGAISGVLGAYLVLFPLARVHILSPTGVVGVPAYMVLGLWIVMQLALGYSALSAPGAGEQGGVAYAAHIGGFAAGLVLAAAFGRRGGARAGAL